LAAAMTFPPFSAATGHGGLREAGTELGLLGLSAGRERESEREREREGERKRESKTKKNSSIPNIFVYFHNEMYIKSKVLNIILLYFHNEKKMACIYILIYKRARAQQGTKNK
jgi:hypothetical protein